MAIVKPFKALRPSRESAHKVASVPYDVVNTEEAAQQAEGNKLSFLRISRAEIELDRTINPYSKDVYQKAKANLDDIRKNAPLIQDKEDHYYIYRLEMDGRKQTGLAAVFSVDDYDNDVILKHEKTRKEKEDDRTNHIITTEAQTGPVFLTYKGIASVNKIIDSVMAQPAEYSFTAADGIKHEVWVMPEQYNKEVEAALAKVPHLYIADGHHRAASASRARKVKQDANSSHTGKEDYNYLLAVLFPAEQLKILPYYRVVVDLNGKNKDEFMGAVKEKFDVEKTTVAQPEVKRTYGMYLDGQWYQLKPKDSVKASLSLANSVASSLDVSILQEFLLNPVLGIDDPRTNKRIDFVCGIRGTKELESIVDSKKAVVAFSLYPVTVEDLMKISDAGEIMPPKSTWFEPKLRDGLLIHTI